MAQAVQHIARRLQPSYPLKDSQQAPAMTDQKFYPYYGPEMVRKICKDRFKDAKEELRKAKEELRKADSNIRVKFGEHNKAQDNMDNILDQMKEKTADLPYATKKDIDVASITLDEYSVASAYCTEVYGNYKAALKTRVNAYKKFIQAKEKMKQASNNMKVVKQRFSGEATDSDASVSDASDSNTTDSSAT